MPPDAASGEEGEEEGLRDDQGHSIVLVILTALEVSAVPLSGM